MTDNKPPTVIHFRWLDEPDVGVWCGSCALPSGVAVHAVMETETAKPFYPVTLRVARCAECGAEL